MCKVSSDNFISFRQSGRPPSGISNLRDVKCISSNKKRVEMLSSFFPIGKFVNKQRRDSEDSLLFQLHYIWTTGILIMFVLIYCAKDIIGEPIRCVNSKSTAEDLRKLTETFCHIKSLYTVHRKDGDGREPYNKEFNLYPGVRQFEPRRDYMKRHTYYIWSSFFIFFLAVFFYAPRYIWKKVDDGDIASFSDKLTKVISAKGPESNEFDEMSQHFMNHLGYNMRHTILFLLCETSNIFVTVLSMIVTNAFLGYDFFDYGSEVLKDIRNQNYDEFNHPMAMVKRFPSVSKCDWRQSGQSGNLEVLDIVCVLPLNNVNDKVFLLLWIHFIFLMSVSMLWVIWRVVPLMSLRVRRKLLMNAMGKLSSHDELTVVSNFIGGLQYPDWFTLYQLRSQMDVVYYKTFIVNVARYDKEKKFHEDYDYNP